ncbi:MAG: phosphoribosylanthranilate isomerase [Actinobacteria bacterium]|nr:phosphoribosylanthranilate isomerase [Actinomycetota bacterium]
MWGRESNGTVGYGAPFIKACGITRPEDGLAACAAGFTAVGFVFAPGPRQVHPDRARQIASRLPASVLRVGVFLDHDEEEVREIAAFCSLDLVQLHGPSRDLAPRFSGKAIPSLQPRTGEDLEALEDYHGAFAVLLDTWDPKLPGGTGRVGDWGLAAEAARRSRVILAGGLNPANVTDAVSRVRPFGIDVSSGVEAAPGIKDPARLRDFAAAAWAAFAGSLYPAKGVKVKNRALGVGDPTGAGFCTPKQNPSTYPAPYGKRWKETEKPER